jgi:hypothetical protein
MSLRSVLYVIALILAGAFLCVLGGLCAVAFLVERNCGSAFYYGC